MTGGRGMDHGGRANTANHGGLAANTEKTESTKAIRDLHALRDCREATSVLLCPLVASRRADA
jgi:hypothetical protein